MAASAGVHPDHFAPGEAEKRPRYSNYPFSAGPRIEPSQDLEPEFVGTLRPRNATLVMSLHPR